MKPEMLNVSRHPIVQTALTQLRDIGTGPEEFRRQLRRITSCLTIEALADLPTRQHSVTTPMGQCAGLELARQVVLVPILRAGLGMVEPILEFVPNASVWHVGLYRNEETLEPVEYYNKIPHLDPESVCLVLDPMLATAGSAVRACRILRQKGATNLKMLCILSAPEGIRKFQGDLPDVQVFTSAVDSHLNDIGYIVPGLGDAGDRIFHT
ncbi:MAG: uracil phosphoribosyltransferase [Isosphaeraceae bacterium]